MQPSLNKVVKLVDGRYLCRQILWNCNGVPNQAKLHYLEINGNRVVVYPFCQELANASFIDKPVFMISCGVDIRDLMDKLRADPYESALNYIACDWLASFASGTSCAHDFNQKEQSANSFSAIAVCIC